MQRCQGREILQSILAYQRRLHAVVWCILFNAMPAYRYSRAITMIHPVRCAKQRVRRSRSRDFPRTCGAHVTHYISHITSRATATTRVVACLSRKQPLLRTLYVIMHLIRLLMMFTGNRCYLNLLPPVNPRCASFPPVCQTSLGARNWLAGKRLYFRTFAYLHFVLLTDELCCIYLYTPSR